MKHIIAISGGKDSQATAIYIKKNQPDVDPEYIFCDTKWEAPETQIFLLYLESVFNKKIKRLSHKKYNGVLDLAKQKSRFPSTTRRFCTTILKVEVTIDYILSIKSDVTVYLGERWEESASRSTRKRVDDYFKYYTEPRKYDKKGKPVYDTYRRKEVLSHIEKFDIIVCRPILGFKIKEVFDYIRSNGQKWNPLYNVGFNRVGCFPCIQCSHGEVALMILERPERLEMIRNAEKNIDSTFFPPGYIPERFCTKRAIRKRDSSVVMVPTIDDVINYIEKRRQPKDLFAMTACRNNYMPCE